MAHVPHFLVEIHMADAGAPELERAMPDAGRRSGPLRTRRARHAHDHRRPQPRGRRLLVCLIEARDLDAARRLFALALLPPGRIREITLIAESAAYSSSPPRRRC